MPPEAHASDEALILRAREDKEALGVLIERYEAPLSRYLGRLGIRDREDVTDLLQEIFIKVYRNLNEFDTSLRFSSWVYRISHNEAMSWFRKRHVRPEGHLIGDGDELVSSWLSEETGGEDAYASGENRDTLARAIDSLDTRYREVIILRFFEHKEYDEISDILKIPTGSVGTLLHRAKAKLRERISTERMNL
jgi:RNA polymerase sigma-70 factor (ECF subfamily)